jgi:alkylhydroperoxidase family enzyme
MAEARIARLTEEEAALAAEGAGVPAIMAPLSVFRVLLRHPRLAGALTGLLTTLLFESKLDPRLRELVIMRIGWATGSEYEWTQHWAVATRTGMEDVDIPTARDWRAAPDLDAPARAVLAATDETLETGTVSAATWTECEQHVGGPEELLELVVAIGNRRLFSSLLRTLEIPLEDGVDAWPPDGLCPRVHCSESGARLAPLAMAPDTPDGLRPQ